MPDEPLLYHRPKKPGILRIVHDPTDSPTTARLLTEVADLDRGILAIRPTPGTVARTNLALAILQALGKQLPDKATTRIPGIGDLWDLTRAWVTGHAVDHLIVDRAHTLNASLRRDLVALAAESGARLWLIDSSPATRPVSKDQRRNFETVAPAQLIELAAHQPSTRWERDEYPAPSVGDITVPAAGVLNFRSTARRTLAPGDVDNFDAVWADATTNIAPVAASMFYLRRGGSLAKALIDNTNRLSGALADAFNRANTFADAQIRLRAVQARLLRWGVLLHHEPSRAHPIGLGCQLSPVLSAAVHRHLSTTAAAAAIARLLYPLPTWTRYGDPDQTVGTSFAEIDGSTLHIDGAYIGVPPYARPALAAHHAWAKLTHPEPDHHPYFPNLLDAYHRSDDLFRQLDVVPYDDAPQRPGARDFDLLYTDGRSFYPRDRRLIGGNASNWMRRRRLWAQPLPIFGPHHGPNDAW